MARQRDPGIERQIRKLEQQADKAPPGTQARYLNQAADLCLRAGDKQRALEYFGQAINLYLKEERPREAAGVCRKLVRHVPDVVRAHRTLSLVAIGEGYTGEAERAIGDYVSAAQRTGRTRLAINQLPRMAALTDDADLRRFIADRIAELGDEKGAEDVRASAELLPVGGPTDVEERWTRVTRAALAGPKELST